MILSATGHRPNKLGGYSKDVQDKLKNLAISFLSKEKPDKIITGMALGWDTAWARAGLSLQIPVLAAIPFYGQESMWPGESKKSYFNILEQCEDVVYVCDKGYAPWKMQIRNEYMVDKCDKVVALWDGSEGGTGNCIRYAVKANKPIINLWKEYNE